MNKNRRKYFRNYLKKLLYAEMTIINNPAQSDVHTTAQESCNTLLPPLR